MVVGPAPTKAICDFMGLQCAARRKGARNRSNMDQLPGFIGITNPKAAWLGRRTIGPVRDLARRGSQSGHDILVANAAPARLDQAADAEQE